ncbi:MAG: hypothetical protein DMF98_04075, partial [Acidobacteria bacterium]
MPRLERGRQLEAEARGCLPLPDPGDRAAVTGFTQRGTRAQRLANRLPERQRRLICGSCRRLGERQDHDEDTHDSP